MTLPVQNFSLVLTLCSFLCAHLTFSQQIRTYDSIYTPAPDLRGKATFEYYEDSEGRKIKDGAFRFVREERTPNSHTTAVYNSWTGQYDENEKVGEWTYEKRQHLVSINEISEVNLDYSVVTIDEILKINYAAGFPNGKIQLESTLYADKKPLKRLKFFETEISQGRMQGEFNFFLADENEEILTIYGNLQDGLMVGKWDFNYLQNEEMETREYENGILLSMLRSSEEFETETIEFPISEGLAAALKGKESRVELANKPLSLHFSDGYPRTSVYIRVQQKGEDALRMLLEEIFQYDRQIDISQRLPLGTNRGFYPLYSEERKKLVEWAEEEALYRHTISELNNLRIESLHLVKDDAIASILEWTKKQEEIRDYIKPWNNILSTEQVEYYNREGLLKEYARDLLHADTVHVGGETTIIEYEPKEEPENFLYYIVDNFRDRNRVGDSLITEFSEKVETLEVNREIAGLQDAIITTREEVDSIYEIPVNVNPLDQLLQKVKRDFGNRVYREEFQRFRQEEDQSQKISIGQELVVNLELMKEIHETTVLIAERTEEIDELYTDLVFDPFTFSDQVPVRKKKRLYNFVTEEVIEPLLSRASRNTSEPAEVLKDLQLVYQMQERLRFLEDKNTRRLERRLQKSKSLDESVELLNSL